MVQQLQSWRRLTTLEDGGVFWGGERIDYRDGEPLGNAIRRHAAKTNLATACKPAAKPKPTKPIASRSAPVGSRELAAAILADFGQAACADAIARGLTYRQVAETKTAELKAKQARLETELANRERRAKVKGIRFSQDSFRVFGNDPKPAA